MTIQKKMAKGSMWSVIEKGGQQLVSFVLFMIIARLVGPEQYGLAMLCFVILTFSQLLLLGMADGVVSLQLKDDTRLSQLFWIITLTGLLLSYLCFIYAESIANAFNAPDVVSLVKYFSPVPFLMGLTAIPHMLVIQRMDFKIYAIRSLVATTGSGIVGVTLAYYGYGAESIIIQQIVLYILTNLILWFYVGWCPSLACNIQGLKHILRPGINMLGSNILTFIEQQIPRLFIGRYLGATNVGYFSFAFRMRFALQEILIAPALITLFPVLSQIKTNKDLQDEILENIFFLVGLFVFPIVILAALTAPLYVPLLFGDKWVDAVPLLQIFLSLGIFAPFLTISIVIFRSYNKVNLLIRLQFVIVFVFIVAAYYSSHHSLMAVGMVVFTISVLRIPAYFYLIKRTTELSIGIYLKAMFKSIISTVIMGILVYLYINYFSVDMLFLDLILALIIGAVVYLCASFALQGARILISIKQLKVLLIKVKTNNKDNDEN